MLALCYLYEGPVKIVWQGETGPIYAQILSPSFSLSGVHVSDHDCAKLLSDRVPITRLVVLRARQTIVVALLRRNAGEQGGRFG